MSTDYTPTATYHGSVTLPSDGDDANANSVNAAALKFLADNTALLKIWSFDIWSTGGVTVAPAGPITFDGGPYTFVSGFTVSSIASFNNTVNLSGALNVGLATHLESTLQVDSTLNAGQDVDAARDVNVGRNLSVTGTAEIETLGVIGAATVNGALDVIGATELDGPLVLNGVATAFQPITTSGAGRVVERVTTITTAGSDISGIGPANADTVWIFGLTANVNFTILGAGAQNFDKIRIINSSNTTHSITVKNPSGGVIITLELISGQASQALIQNVGGVWLTVTQETTP
jgi:hypothetical protein